MLFYRSTNACCAWWIYGFTLYVSAINRVTSDLRGIAQAPASRVCLPGPDIDEDYETDGSASHTGRNCLILGDSISIGYTPDVQRALAGKCNVYHAPWDIGDGGALDTKHGLECLKVLTASSKMNSVMYDVVVFNFGLHDVDCDQNKLEEFTSLVNYTRNLETLKKFFLDSGARLVYALTTPVLNDCDINGLVVRYNKAARRVMVSTPTVQVVDLYKLITDRCGESLEKRHIKCPITKDELVPHYTPYGYRLMAGPVARAILTVLEDDDRKFGSSNFDFDSGDEGSSDWSEKVNCKSKQGVIVSACPANSTCVANSMSGSGFACCLLPHATDCKDGTHCCPGNTNCAPGCNNKKCSCLPKCLINVYRLITKSHTKKTI